MAYSLVGSARFHLTWTRISFSRANLTSSRDFLCWIWYTYQSSCWAMLLLPMTTASTMALNMAQSWGEADSGTVAYLGSSLRRFTRSSTEAAGYSQAKAEMSPGVTPQGW